MVTKGTKQIDTTLTKPNKNKSKLIKWKNAPYTDFHFRKTGYFKS
jgi:hypothetical protein